MMNIKMNSTISGVLAAAAGLFVGFGVLQAQNRQIDNSNLEEMRQRMMERRRQELMGGGNSSQVETGRNRPAQGNLDPAQTLQRMMERRQQELG